MTEHPLNKLPARTKKPTTARAIDAWIQQAESKAGMGSRRLGWMVASGIVLAALQRVLHDDAEPRFLLKGGVLLELRLGLRARATGDLDTLFRGRFDDFIEALDQALVVPFDGFELERTDVEIIDADGRVHKPRRFGVKLKLRGKTWRRIQVEVSADEGGVGSVVERFERPSLAHFGVTTPPTTAGITIDYQVAQKLHACTDPHTEEKPNERVRDVVDLCLLKTSFYDGDAKLISLRNACLDVFEARAAEAAVTGYGGVRNWPPVVVAYPQWYEDYPKYAASVGQLESLEAAVSLLNEWIEKIDSTKD